MVFNLFWGINIYVGFPTYPIWGEVSPPVANMLHSHNSQGSIPSQCELGVNMDNSQVADFPKTFQLNAQSWIYLFF